MIGETGFNQLRDENGYLSNVLSGLPFTVRAQCFTLTANTVKNVTVPSGNTSSYTAVIRRTAGADVLLLPASSPTLTAPNGTVTAVAYELLPVEVEKLVIPGQSLQFLYANTVYTGSTVTVWIGYYANS